MGNEAAWTQAEDAALADLIAKGKSFSQAGAELGRSKNACISRARRIGVKTSNPPSLWMRKAEHAGSVWTPELIAALHTHRARGLTLPEIAVAMKRSFRSIRNAVRKFNANAPANHQSHIQRRIAAAKPKSQAKKPDLSYANTLFGDGVSFADLQNNQCRWPVGDTNYVYCGGKRTKGSYCDVHHALAYGGRRATPLERRAAEKSARAALVRAFS